MAQSIKFTKFTKFTKFIKPILSKCIFIFLALFVAYLYTKQDNFYTREALENYGNEKMAISAPLAYRTFATSLKYPTLGTNVDPVYQAITSDTPYTSKIFNQKNNQKYYSQAEMENDFMYFNNASNIGLSQMFNVEDIDEATEPMPVSTFHQKLFNKYDDDLSDMLQEPPYSYEDFKNNFDNEYEKEMIGNDLRYANSVTSMTMGLNAFKK